MAELTDMGAEKAVKILGELAPFLREKFTRAGKLTEIVLSDGSRASLSIQLIMIEPSTQITDGQIGSTEDQLDSVGDGSVG